MLDEILDTIKTNNMLEKCDQVIVALSGGADSVSLLLALDELKNILDINLSAIHVNHCLRGKESDSDEQFCTDLCSRLNIPLIKKSFNVMEYAQKNKLSTELAARNIRYDFFKEQSYGKKIATAHTANDNAETVILNLTRGTGIRGISGIPPVRNNIIRPLINTTRDTIEEYLKNKSQDYVTDRTNLSDDYTRNRIRHNVIPVLKEINFSLFNTIASDSANLRLDDSFISSESEKAYLTCHKQDNQLTGLKNYHKAIRHRCISLFLNDNNIEVSHKRICQIDRILTGGGKINLCKNIYIISSEDNLIIREITPCSSGHICFPLTENSSIFLGKKITITRTDNLPEGKNILLDSDKLSGSLKIRNRLPGDRIMLKGNNFTSSVKKLFNRNIPLEDRDRICFICDDQGPVYIEKTGISQRAAISDNTVNFIVIKIECE